MPEVIIRHELYQTFGSRSDYLATPWPEVQEERLRIVAEHTVKARQDDTARARIAEQEREVERVRNGGR